MKTFKLDANWEKVVSGEMTLVEWQEQAEEGAEIDMVEGDALTDYEDEDSV